MAEPQEEVLLPLNIRERVVLYSSYMSFVRGGGIFVPTKKKFKLGDSVLLAINIDIPAHHIEERLPVKGKVVWVTPDNLQPGRVSGIGVQFTVDEAGKNAQAKIESALGRHLASNRETYTL
ncbi:MAG: PilZ domain-containing protein [Burkholderiales bacterium]|jgi:type IV pilus assembly protein PilZ|nr:PilZ domain-containing protein [Burkholderiales bacterium]